MCQLFSMLVIVHLHESKKALPRVDIWHAYVLQAVQLNDLALQVGFYSSLVACHEKNNVSHTHTQPMAEQNTLKKYAAYLYHSQ